MDNAQADGWQVDDRYAPSSCRQMVALLIAFALVLAISNLSPGAALGAERPKVGVVLAGGGARGGAHIGVLRALERAHIPIDYIAGTSVGAIIAALYAVGYTPDEMEKFIADIHWSDALADRIPREELSLRRKADQEIALFEPGLGYTQGALKLRSGLILGQNINVVLARIGAVFPAETNFDHLAVPLRAVATDIATGRAVVLDHGDLTQVLRASMAVPGVFSPVEIGGQLLVDGGVADNLPIDVVRSMGADIVIAVDVSSPLLTREQIHSPLDVTEQLTSVLTRRNVVAQIATLGANDVLIVPDLQKFGTADFDRMIAMVPAGEAAVLNASATLAKLALPAAAFARLQLARTTANPRAPRIAFFTIDNRSHVANSTLARQMRLDELIGKPLQPDVLNRHFGVAYGSELFETVSYETVRRGDAYGIKVIARENSWGPNYLKLRVLTQGDLTGTNGVSIGVDFDLTDATKYSGEWRNYLQLGQERLIFTELYQPLSDRSDWYVLPRLQYQRRERGLFDARGDRIAGFEVSERTAELRLGYEMGTTARLESGVRAGRFSADRLIGTGVPKGAQRHIGEWFTSYTLDTLDNRNFPQRGVRLGLTHLGGRERLGGDDNFDQWDFSFDAATAIDHTHIVTRALYQRTFHGTAPIYRQAQLGGFFRMSGISADQLTGQSAAFIGASLFQRFDTPLISTFIGATFEYGNVFQRDAILVRDGLWSSSLWTGADTPLGPAYLGYGIVQGGNQTFFLSLGRPL